METSWNSPRYCEALLGDAPAGVPVLAQHTQPDEVVERARERGCAPASRRSRGSTPSRAR